ncbi:hypothetical protein SAMN02982994_5906 [Azospirillum lipoferum]|nr:hypothetical protein SAMN02982994_5906 [Azospirillum lipoferum]
MTHERSQRILRPWARTPWCRTWTGLAGPGAVAAVAWPPCRFIRFPLWAARFPSPPCSSAR